MILENSLEDLLYDEVDRRRGEWSQGPEPPHGMSVSGTPVLARPETGELARVIGGAGAGSVCLQVGHSHGEGRRAP